MDPAVLFLTFGALICITLGLFDKKRKPRNRMWALIGGLLCVIIAYIVLNMNDGNR